MSQPRILIADDDGEIRRFLRCAFSVKSWVVETVADGKEALSVLISNCYDLVILDLKMPILTGLDILKVLKHRKIQIYVIILTGYGDCRSCVESMKNGAVDYFEKPVHLNLR